jgi:hypothetical protein
LSDEQREDRSLVGHPGDGAVPESLVRPAGRKPRSGKGDGSIPARIRRIFGDEIDRLREGLLLDLGGPEAISTAEGMLINAVLEAHAIRRLLGHRILCRGACDRKGEVKPAVLSFFTALNSERLNLVALGLRRRAKSLPTLDGLWKADSAASSPIPGASEPDANVEAKVEDAGDPS